MSAEASPTRHNSLSQTGVLPRRLRVKLRLCGRVIAWSTRRTDRPEGLPITFEHRGCEPRPMGQTCMSVRRRVGLPDAEPRSAAFAIIGPLATGEDVFEFR